MKRYLVLEDGHIFAGEGFGADREVLAEVVFATGMVGMTESLTDPSYAGQALVQTFPETFTVGAITADAESDIFGPDAYIVRHWSEHPSNFRAELRLDDWLASGGIAGLGGIDTRALTRIIREHGVMNGFITDDPARADATAIRDYRVRDAVARVSTKTPYTVGPDRGAAAYRVALLDYGMKRNILRSLTERGCEVTVLPHDTTGEQVLALSPDGIFLSNGPGDPADNVQEIAVLQTLCRSGLPIMGICLGHQLLALAHGFKTEKMRFGHRGANQPVRDRETGRVCMSTQNHGYAVARESIDEKLAGVWFENANDNTVEGIRYKDAPIASVQFHPEACAGPRDTRFLFDSFINMMAR